MFIACVSERFQRGRGVSEFNDPALNKIAEATSDEHLLETAPLDQPAKRRTAYDPMRLEHSLNDSHVMATNELNRERSKAASTMQQLQRDLRQTTHGAIESSKRLRSFTKWSAPSPCRPQRSRTSSSRSSLSFVPLRGRTEQKIAFFFAAKLRDEACMDAISQDHGNNLEMRLAGEPVHSRPAHASNHRVARNG